MSSFQDKTNAALVILANKSNDLNAKGKTRDTAIAGASSAAAAAQAAANAKASIDDTAPASTATAYSAAKTEARIKAVVTADVATALEGEDLSDLAEAVSQNAAQQVNLATAASVAAVGEDVATLATDLGNVATFDPVGAVTTALNF